MSTKDNLAQKNSDVFKNIWIYLNHLQKYCPTFFVITATLTFISSMVIYPIITHWGNWEKIQNIWDRWQTLNSAVIALTASIIAYKATIYNYRKDRENNFRAARSKLPHALSDLMAHSRECANYYAKLHTTKPLSNNESSVSAAHNLPIKPDAAIDVFVECIKYAEIDIGVYLSKILEELQVIRSRMNLAKQGSIRARSNIAEIKYIARSCIKINSLFKFSRNQESFNPVVISTDKLKRIVRIQLGIKDFNVYDEEN